MIELRTLGSVELKGPRGRDYAAILVQPKRLALLTWLALARPGGFARRDTLVALFWPEIDTEHARAALRQAIRFLRRALGDEVIVSRGDELGVDAEVLWCDAVALDAACRADELAEAVALFRGDLLAGLYVSEASTDLEQWIEDERVRLRRTAVAACWTLVERSETSGSLPFAIEYARRAVALAPTDEPGMRRLLALLGRAGDGRGAESAYRQFARRLAAELEVEPERETTELLRAIVASGGRQGTPLAPAPDDTARDRSRVAGTATHAATAAPERGQPAALPSAIPSRGRRRWIVALVTVLILLGAGAVAREQRLAGRVPASPSAEAASPAPGGARDLYLKARVLHVQGTMVSLSRAATFLERAVRLDPEYAAAYGLLGLVYVQIPMFGDLPPNEAYPRAQEAALRALELDASSAEATLALAMVSSYFHWRWAEADRLYRRAIALDTSRSETHVAYGDFLSSSGRLAESIGEFERAKLLDPSSRRALNNLARRLIWAGELERARIQLDSALTLEPNYARGHRTLGILYLHEGRHADAIAVLTRAAALSHDRPFDLSVLAQAHWLAGDRDEARRILRGLEARAKREYVPPYAIATLHALTGRHDDAFTWLDSALDAHDPTMSVTVLYEPMLDPVRGDPRFAAVLRRMRLAP